jgi:O-antigen ligase
MTMKDYSGKIFIILLLSFFLPVVTSFVSGTDMRMSGALSADKAVKAVLLYAVLMTVVGRDSIRIRKDVWKYLLPAAAILLLLLTHYHLSEVSGIEGFMARKEVIRVTGFLLIFLLSSAVSFRSSDFRFLVYCLAAMALVAGALSVWHSLAGTTSRIDMQAGEYIRAGVGRVGGPNKLGAVLNLMTMAALAGFCMKRGVFSKTAFLVAALAAQAGRFATFSTGSLLNIIAALLAALVLLKNYEQETFKKFLYLILFMALVSVTVIFATGKGQLLFHRAMLSDEVVIRSSVYSRLNQYYGLLEIIKDRPWGLVFGFGAIEEPHMLGTRWGLHNAYLRPLLTSGIGGFLSFLVLYWLSIKNFFHSIKDSVADRGHRIICIFMSAAFIGWSVQASTSLGDTSVVQWFYFIFAYCLAGYSAAAPGYAPGSTLRREGGRAA